MPRACGGQAVRTEKGRESKRDREILLRHRAVASASSAAASYGGAPAAAWTRGRGRWGQRGTLARAPGGACSGARSHSPGKQTPVGVGEQGNVERNWGVCGKSAIKNGAWMDFAAGLGSSLHSLASFALFRRTQPSACVNFLPAGRDGKRGSVVGAAGAGVGRSRGLRARCSTRPGHPSQQFSCVCTAEPRVD